MKFLVFGFSVTAETPGYVERCVELCQSRHPDYEIVKVGIGGLQPNHARHLIADVIARHRPDALVLEFSTAAYRLQEPSPFRRRDQIATISSVFRLCKENDMRCGILDLPLSGLNPDADWVDEVNQTLCLRHRVPRRKRDLLPETVWDNVHPNDLGKELYAETLCGLLEEVAVSTPDFSALDRVPHFGACSVADLDISGGYLREFSRHGYVSPMIAVPVGDMVKIKLPRPLAIVGMIVGIGPKSGTMIWAYGGRQEAMPCYDGHCYYERVGGRPLPKAVTEGILVAQSAAMPTVKLLKGVQDTGPRIGGLTHILYEE